MNPIIQLKQTTSASLVALLLASIAIPWSAQASGAELVPQDQRECCVCRSNNIAVGRHAGDAHTTGDNNIYVGNKGVENESHIIRIGDSNHKYTFIAGIAGVNEGVPNSSVFINTDTGQLGTAPPASSRQYKKEIKPMDKVSDAILALKPVTFQ